MCFPGSWGSQGSKRFPRARQAGHLLVLVDEGHLHVLAGRGHQLAALWGGRGSLLLVPAHTDQEEEAGDDQGDGDAWDQDVEDAHLAAVPGTCASEMQTREFSENTAPLIPSAILKHCTSPLRTSTSNLKVQVGDRTQHAAGPSGVLIVNEPGVHTLLKTGATLPQTGTCWKTQYPDRDADGLTTSTTGK